MPSTGEMLIDSGVGWTKAMASRVWVHSRAYCLSSCKVTLGRDLRVFTGSDDELVRMHAALLCVHLAKVERGARRKMLFSLSLAGGCVGRGALDTVTCFLSVRGVSA